MTAALRRFHDRRQSGAALLAVLWVIALLIGLVAGASLLLLQDVDQAAVRRQTFRARMLAEAALAIAMNPEIKPDDPLLRQRVAVDESFQVEMRGEDGLINPNVLLLQPGGADRDTLRRVFGYWGLRLQQAEALIDCMIDWVDADDFKAVAGAESKSYGLNGMPFNRPFRSLEEMAMVRGMQEVEAAYPDWRKWFSVYASGRIDVSSADPAIVSAVTGADIRAAQTLRTFVVGRDGLQGTEDDGKLTDLADALNHLGLPASQAQVLGNRIGIDSATRRILVNVDVGDLHRQLAAITRGALNQGSTAILWMGER